ncbi:MAG: kelch repeat-containing protein [Myxococcota bacterium]
MMVRPALVVALLPAACIYNPGHEYPCETDADCVGPPGSYCSDEKQCVFGGPSPASSSGSNGSSSTPAASSSSANSGSGGSSSHSSSGSSSGTVSTSASGSSSGSTGSSSGPDTTPPDAPGAAGLRLTRFPAGTPDRLLGAAGTVEANATVVVYDQTPTPGAPAVASVVADGAGGFGPIDVGDNRGDANADLHVIARDAAGNRSGATLVHNDPVPPVLTVDQFAVVHERRLHGIDAPDGGAGPRMGVVAASGAGTIFGDAFTFDGIPARSVTFWREAYNGAPLATVVRTGDGSWPTVPFDSDGVTVEVTGEDATGGNSTPVRLAENVWVVNSGEGSAVAGGTQFPEGLAADPDVSVVSTCGTAAYPLAQEDGCGLVASPKPLWRRTVFSAAAPPPARSAGLVYDDERGVLVRFGGDDANGPQDATYEWDGSGWRDGAPLPMSPRARTRHAMAYDPSRRRTVVFGGSDGNVRLSDTWEYDGSTWTLVAPSNSGPSARDGAAMAYDEALGAVVLVGGNTGVVTEEMWSWDGLVWTRRTPETLPPAREAAAMAYDDARGRLVLFGGQGTSGALDDLWEWNGLAWSMPEVAGDAPGARTAAAMAYDRARSRVVLLGGDDGGGALSEGWEWNGTTWTNISPPLAALGPRRQVAAAYHARLGRVVVNGGDNGVAVHGDTLLWDGNATREYQPDGVPAAVSGDDIRLPLVYDFTRAVLVYVDTKFSDDPNPSRTWEWNGVEWLLRLDSSNTPYAMGAFRAAHDGARGETLLFVTSRWFNGSELQVQDTWAWNGTAWRVVAGGLGSRYGASLAFDQARGVVVLFGGVCTSCTPRYRGDTWTWDGSSWTRRAETGPAGRSYAGMTYDADRQLVQLVGGYDSELSFMYDATMWEWDGTEWTAVPAQGPGPNPVFNVNPSLIYDDARRRTVAIVEGGLTWDWDTATSTWQALPTLGRVDVPSMAEGYAWDSARERAAAAAFGVLWELDLDSSRRAAVHLDAAWSGAGLTRGDVTSVSVRALCAAGTTGASLYVRDASGWRLVDENAAPLGDAEPHVPGAPASLLEWSSGDVTEARNVAANPAVPVAAQCRARSLLDDVAADFIEVRLRYRTP